MKEEEKALLKNSSSPAKKDSPSRARQQPVVKQNRNMQEARVYMLDGNKQSFHVDVRLNMLKLPLFNRMTSIYCRISVSETSDRPRFGERDLRFTEPRRERVLLRVVPRQPQSPRKLKHTSTTNKIEFDWNDTTDSYRAC